MCSPRPITVRETIRWTKDETLVGTLTHALTTTVVNEVFMPTVKAEGKKDES